jgi:hypothetical protein
MTILGHTAPADSGGITIKGAVRINGDNWIIRYLRFAPGDNGYRDASGNIVGTKPSGVDFDGLSLTNCNNIIVDHCSVRWSIDENLSASNCETVTLSNNIVSEALHCSVHSESCHSMGGLIGGSASLASNNITVYNSYYHANRDRNLRTASSTYEIVNTVFFAFVGSSGYSSGQSWTNIGNEWKEGNATLYDPNRVTAYTNDSVAGHTGNVYIEDNINDYGAAHLDSRWESYLVATKEEAVWSGNIVPIPAANVFSTISPHIGASYPFRDSVDARAITNYSSGGDMIIDTPAQVGGYPVLAAGTPYTDSNNDGIDDTWFAANVPGGDTSTDLAPSGYSWVEVWAEELLGTPVVNAPVITLTGAATINITIGGTYTEQGATWTDVEDGTGAATVGGDTVDTNTIGTYIITYDHTDTNGNAAVQVTRTVNVVSGSAPVISLIGSSFITLEVGSGAYVEQGATATDTEDGDLTGDIVIGGDTVDTNTIGVYMVTYNVTDTNGNPATQVTRTINVVDSVVIEGTTLGINKNILFSI